MRSFTILFLLTAMLGNAQATDLGTQPSLQKTSAHVGQNPGTPNNRQGGEDMSSAFIITALPYQDTGNTTGHIDDYDAVCPYYDSTAPDVVYSFTPDHDCFLRVDLCGSGYDTKTYILDPNFNLIACNDDAYFDDVCGEYVSLIEEVALTAGNLYFIIIDGYGADTGDYNLNLTEIYPEPPCIVECEGVNEGEPMLGPAYEDTFNGGCNSPEFGYPFSDLTWSADWDGNLTYCGIAGWTDTGRDTDWAYLRIGLTGEFEVTVDAEQPTNVYLLAGNCQDGITVESSMTVGPCSAGSMTVTGEPDEIVLMWFGASEFTPPAGFVGYEYSYTAEFTGLGEYQCIIPTQKTTIGHIKSLYR